MPIVNGGDGDRFESRSILHLLAEAYQRPAIKSFPVVALSARAGMNAVGHEAGHGHRHRELDFLLPINLADLDLQAGADLLRAFLCQLTRIELDLEFVMDPVAQEAAAPVRV